MRDIGTNDINIGHTADRCLTPREAALAAATIEELIEIVRDLTRRVAMCEVEIAGRRIEIEDDF